MATPTPTDEGRGATGDGRRVTGGPSARTTDERPVCPPVGRAMSVLRKFENFK